MSRQNHQAAPVGDLTSQHLIDNNQAPAPISEPSTSSEATSSPYVPTPLSISSNDLPLPKTHHSHHYSQAQQPQQQQHRSSSLQSSIIHEPPYIPSTFLPSYYSESRLQSSSSLFPSGSIPGIPEITEVESEVGAKSGVGADNQALREKISRIGPSADDLLEGIKSPFPASISAASRSQNLTGDLNGIAGYQSVALMDLAGIPHVRESGLTPENPAPLYSSWSGSSRVPSDTVGLTTWQPGPSSTSASQLSQISQPQSQGYQDSSSESPMSAQRQVSASPRHTHLSLTGSNPSPRFQPYANANANAKHQRAVSSASPATSGSMLPPPHPQQQQSVSASSLSNPYTMSMGRSWSEPNLPDNTPHSAGYPGIMYANVPLPEGYMATPPLGGRAMDGIHIGPEEFARATDMYSYILSAIPYIAPCSESDPDHGSATNSAFAPRQTFDSLIELSAESYRSLTGSTPPIQPLHPANTTDGFDIQKGKRRNSSSALDGMSINITTDTGTGGMKKATPKCLGCGATETPEWRRGPMGPRTLCNACGLVHMKLQRKKRKAEEKAKAAAAAGDITKPG
ncbi:uncharacterized protein I303_102868 [Kwoniella dejecticola CBS 10117]|uniref:GATA-type domain-containing protein n=1 Tax=Kwoniella dejecticola CBS 10117 TaxID=1296121 RepID=A0A1A6A9Y4_9TREE|nr:uncharacterized protein I303_02886 [Kwoniella dejecticola CBS 10117]OBR86867.1 hypothetical protein I303_02886 [Kwoniella dejecticola CBS 10117]